MSTFKKNSKKSKNSGKVNRAKSILKSKEKTHKMARKIFGTKKCSKGEVERSGYKKRSGTWVAPTCIEAKGLAKITGHKGTPTIWLEKDVLGKFGYHDVRNMSTANRQAALKKALRTLPALPLFRRLSAISSLHVRTNPDVSKIFKKDADWIRKQKEYINRPTSKKSKKSKKIKRTKKTKKTKRTKKTRKTKKTKKSKKTKKTK